MPQSKIMITALCLWCMLQSCTATPAEETGNSLTDYMITDTPLPGNQLPADSSIYQRKLQHLVHNRPGTKWPVMEDEPEQAGVLPYSRILAYYGNFYTPAMGVLGGPEAEMLSRLKAEAKRWYRADTMMSVIPAIHYIAVTAQRNPGISGKYRLRMPPAQINKAINLATTNNMLLFLDVQVGLSTLQEELPPLETYLRRPDTHLGIDPEYAMKNKAIPCSSIGTFDAADINYAVSFLANIVRTYHLPPKILVVHRFTQAMLTNYKNIIRVPEVQIVINMDGFGSPAKKIDSYNGFVAAEPVQFTGFKLFYNVDPRTGKRIMEPEEVLALYPSPIYIQYQ